MFLWLDLVEIDTSYQHQQDNSYGDFFSLMLCNASG
jgi:hypothetical protein